MQRVALNPTTLAAIMVVRVRPIPGVFYNHDGATLRVPVDCYTF